MSLEQQIEDLKRKKELHADLTFELGRMWPFTGPVGDRIMTKCGGFRGLMDEAASWVDEFDTIIMAPENMHVNYGSKLSGFVAGKLSGLMHAAYE